MLCIAISLAVCQVKKFVFCDIVRDLFQPRPRGGSVFRYVSRHDLDAKLRALTVLALTWTL